MLAATVSHATGQTLSVQSVEADANAPAELVVTAENMAAMTALQFNLTLPEGVTLDETAVYLYAKTPGGTVTKYIPVHWATDFNGSGIATVELNGVEVTDGTVEIGMVSEKRYTNWHVVQIKGVTALVDAEELHANTLASRHGGGLV